MFYIFSSFSDLEIPNARFLLSSEAFENEWSFNVYGLIEI